MKRQTATDDSARSPIILYCLADEVTHRLKTKLITTGKLSNVVVQQFGDIASLLEATQKASQKPDMIFFSTPPSALKPGNELS